MAVAYDISSAGQTDANSTVTSGAMTVGATANYVVVAVAVETNTAAGGLPVSAVTFDGVSMSFIAGTETTGGTDTDRVELWGLANPNIGAAKRATATITGIVDAIIIVAITFSGVDGVGVNGTNFGASGTGSVAVTTQKIDSMLVDIIIGAGSTNVLTKGASQTQRQNVTNLGNCRAASSTLPTGAIGSKTMSWTFTSQTWAIATVELFGRNMIPSLFISQAVKRANTY